MKLQIEMNDKSKSAWLLLIAVPLAVGVLLLGWAFIGWLVLNALAIIGYGIVAEIGWLNSMAVGFLISIASGIFSRGGNSN